ncbi:MAG: hypothetical protein JJT96_03620 [Opitutales bacterium]|nr:hypothetical protein [Opitutales bacterium]
MAGKLIYAQGSHINGFKGLAALFRGRGIFNFFQVLFDLASDFEWMERTNEKAIHFVSQEKANLRSVKGVAQKINKFCAGGFSDAGEIISCGEFGVKNGEDNDTRMREGFQFPASGNAVKNRNRKTVL